MNLDLDPHFVAYREQARAALVAHGYEWPIVAQSIVRYYRAGVPLAAALLAWGVVA